MYATLLFTASKKHRQLEQVNFKTGSGGQHVLKLILVEEQYNKVPYKN